MPVRLFHVSDPHFGREDAGAVAAFAALVRAERPDAVLCTGDLTMRARGGEFRAAATWLEGFGVPVLVEPGNHDLPYYNPLARLLDPYRRYAAVERSVERPLALPGVVVVPLKTTARVQAGRLSRGRVSRSGLAAALARLADTPAGTLAIVACHHPLVPVGHTHHGATAGGADALARLAAAGAGAVVSGHVHDPFDVAVDVGGRPVRLIGAGTLSCRTRGSPPSFNAITVDEAGLRVVVRTLDGGDRADRASPPADGAGSLASASAPCL